MSEFQLQPGQGYIYVGEYFHKFGKEVPSEKKIGKTDDLMSSLLVSSSSFRFCIVCIFSLMPAMGVFNSWVMLSMKFCWS